jgi:hypothetical protein
LLQKQERRNGPPNWRHAALLQYLELRVYRQTYRLNKGRFLTVNGIRVGVPFQDQNGVRAVINGRYLMLTTPFGLRVLFDGDQTSEMFLCDQYSGHVCGLFGNANGNRQDDFQNPQGQNVPLIGGAWTRYYRWGTTWRLGVDNDIDVDGQHCNTKLPPGTPAPIVCKKREEYRSSQWCGLLKDRTGPWRDCIAVNDNLIEQ